MTETRKVYLATSGEYSDFRVRAVFAREEDARSYGLGEDVEEFILHDSPVEVRAWNTLRWDASRPDERQGDFRLGNPDESSELRDFDGHPDHAEHEWSVAKAPRRHTYLTVRGWDLKRVRKVYSEQRAQYVAQQEGVG